MALGPHKIEYEVIKGWEQLPEGYAFVEVAGVLEYGFKDGEGFGPALNAAAGVRYYF